MGGLNLGFETGLKIGGLKMEMFKKWGGYKRGGFEIERFENGKI